MGRELWFLCYVEPFLVHFDEIANAWILSFIVGNCKYEQHGWIIEVCRPKITRDILWLTELHGASLVHVLESHYISFLRNRLQSCDLTEESWIFNIILRPSGKIDDILRSPRELTGASCCLASSFCTHQPTTENTKVSAIGKAVSCAILCK